MTSKGRLPATGGVIKLEKVLPPERPAFGGRCRDGSHETVLPLPKSGWAERLNEITLLLVRRMAAAGASSEFIADKLGLPEEQVDYVTGRKEPDGDAPVVCAKRQPLEPLLTERQLMILQLRFDGDWSLRAIARGIGCSDSTVRRVYHQALALLEEGVEGVDAEG